MSIDASIPLGVRPVQVADPLESYAKAMTIRGLMQQGELHGLQIDKARQENADDQVLRELAPQAGGDPSKLRDLVYGRGLFKQGMALDKQVLERQAKEAEIKKNLSTASKNDIETASAKFKTLNGAGISAMSAYQDALSKQLPEPMARALAQPAYEAAIDGLAQSGLFDQNFLANLPRTFDPVKVKSSLDQTMTWDKMIDNVRAERAARVAEANVGSEIANRDLIPDGKGGYVTNVPRQESKIRVAQASRPITNVTVNTEKKYGEQFGKLIADADVAMRDAAIKAPDLATRANQIKEVLSSGKVITGTGADVRLQLGKALNLAGANDGETVANTELLSTQLARNTLDAIKASGLGSGSGFSNADRDFLEKAVGGKITLQPETIDRLATLAHKAAAKSAQQWQTRVKQIPAEAVQGTGIGNENISVPPLYQGGGARTVSSLPDPAKYRGYTATDPESGIRYQSDGSSWKRVR